MQQDDGRAEAAVDVVQADAVDVDEPPDGRMLGFGATRPVGDPGGGGCKYRGGDPGNGDARGGVRRCA